MPDAHWLFHSSSTNSSTHSVVLTSLNSSPSSLNLIICPSKNCAKRWAAIATSSVSQLAKGAGWGGGDGVFAPPVLLATASVFGGGVGAGGCGVGVGGLWLLL
jgi:hypothetical protein